ncbi:hypothetical protein [Telmatospirillum sp. J64-1]|uniref:hypothetical protein n=1 Tax=Telmatospirillum sp. J64-1 TaxID=2502183 RepID=UPI00115C67C4|nr:hypothetical protein [Telmatospirillum sp. J64-1]
MPTTIHLKSPARAYITITLPYPGLVSIAAPASFFRAIGHRNVGPDLTQHRVTVSAQEAENMVLRLSAQAMALDIIAITRRTGGECTEADLRRKGWSQALIRKLGAQAKAIATPHIISDQCGNAAMEAA